MIKSFLLSKTNCFTKVMRRDHDLAIVPDAATCDKVFYKCCAMTAVGDPKAPKRSPECAPRAAELVEIAEFQNS
jgi:hypothetical protein